MIKQPNDILGDPEIIRWVYRHHSLTSLNYIVKSKFRTKIGMDYDGFMQHMI